MKSDRLKRTIGVIPATSIGLGAMLGAGIFIFPGLAGGNAGIGAVLSFLIGGAVALLVAFCTAELSTAMPQSGGGYFYISRTFGSFWGTITGIAQWIGLVFACAFYLTSFGEYAITFLEEANIQLSLTSKFFAFLFTLLLLLINIFGTKGVGRAQNIMVISLTFILIIIFSYGIIDYLGFKNNSVSFETISPKGTLSIFTTSALIFTSYLGFVQIANVGAEIKKPGKNLKRSLVASVVIATVLYMSVMLVCSIVFTPSQLSGYGETATIEVARELLGAPGAIITVFAGLLAALSSANASIISASRSIYAVSSDKLIHSAAGNLNKKFNTPHIALFLVCLPIAILLIKSDLEIFAEVASILHLLIYGGICLTLLKLRSSKPKWYFPTFKLSLHKPIAMIGALFCFSLLFFMNLSSLLYSLVIILLTCLYYLLVVYNKKLELETPEPPHIDMSIVKPNILISIDISKNKKDVGFEILQSMPSSKILLVGYKETPEQTDKQQSEEKFEKEGKEKLKDIKDRFEESSFEIEEKLIFAEDINSQFMKLINDNQPHIILKLKPKNKIEQLVVPIYDYSQIKKQLSTLIIELNSRYKKKIKIVLLNRDQGNHSISKKRVKEKFESLNVSIPEFENIIIKEGEEMTNMKEQTSSSDLLIWMESQSLERKRLLNSIIQSEGESLPGPIIFILNDRNNEEKE